jgi:glutamate/tyrosine decarboxylase-like PLP-dependent enzyme
MHVGGSSGSPAVEPGVAVSPNDSLGLDRDTMRELAHQTVELVVDWLSDAGAPPLTRATPAEMQRRLSGPAPSGPEDFDELLGRLERDVLPFMSRVHHPAFFAFVPGSVTWPAVLGDLIASACNVYAGSWMESAGPSQLELEVLGWFKDWIGYPTEAGGTLVSGGSAANMTALACARAARAGWMDDRLVVYASDQAHSSIARAARVLGFRREQVRVLPVDESFRLAPGTLAAALDADGAAGRKPLLVSVNAGATNTGAVDPLAELADLCAQHGLWLHADAAYGGFATLTKRGRAQLSGLELADSITLDPHKWLYQPYECGCLLVRDGRALRNAFEIVPDYLHDARAADDEVNFADLGLQLTRTSRALKVWLSVRTFGLDAFRDAIDRSLDLAALARKRIEASGNLELLAPPSLGIVCFRRLFDGADEDALERLNAGLVAALEESGIGLISSTRLHGRYALRMCVLNHATRADDVERVLDFLERNEPAEQYAPQHERHPEVAAGARGEGVESVDLAALRLHGTERRAQVGEELITRWDSTRELFFVVEGTVEVTIDGRSVAQLGPGEFFGELAALEWGAGFAYPRLATVTAVTALTVLVVPAESLDVVFRDVPGLERQIRRRASLRLLRH